LTVTITQTSQSALRIETDSPLDDFSADDVERLIEELSKFRRNMIPEVQRRIPDTQYERGIVDPIFAVLSDPASEEKTVGIRHPGTGWLLFLLPRDKAQKLGRALLETAPQATDRPVATRLH
jgi:hypothetical protein